MRQYQELLRHILEYGRVRTDRTGTGTRGVFGYQMRFNLADGFPLLTTKKMFTKAIIHELLWFLSGETNVEPLQQAGVSIWDEWATPEQCARFGRDPGELGPVYGHQWRNFGATYDHITGKYRNDGVDQIAKAIETIRKNPDSRRIIVSGWNPREAEQVALPPCHTLFQFYVQDGTLSCQLYQRSGDVFLGVPFNIASYALLTQMIAHTCGLALGEFVHTLGDAHLYNNHIEQAKLQLSREPKPLPRMIIRHPTNDIIDIREDFSFGDTEQEKLRLSHEPKAQPRMAIRRPVSSIFDLRYEDFSLEGYDPHPAIRAEVSV